MSTEEIGRFGELLTETGFLRPARNGFNRPLFRGHNLGEKYPAVDFLVDLLDKHERRVGFFYVQVKSTARSHAKSRKRLPVVCSLHTYNALVALPVPTYLVGANVVTEQLYVVAAHKFRNRDVASIVKSYDLSADEVKVILYEDVLNYWKSQTLEAWCPRLTDA
jgi:hypothetical protein